VRKVLWVIALLLAVVSAPDVHASITYVTPSGSTTGGGAVDASATFTTGSGTVTISLTNLEANPTDVAQAISDLDFVLSNGATSGTLATSSGQEITVNGDGTYTLGATESTGWGLNNNVGGGLQLDALGFSGPATLILGPAGSGGTYSNANGSIAGNGPHNPFLNQTATFTVDVPGVTSATAITGTTFSFGTTAGVDVPGITPEPATMLLFGTGLLVIAGIVRRRSTPKSI
jgi:PEP-CTERM motif